MLMYDFALLFGAVERRKAINLKGINLISAIKFDREQG